MVRPMAMPAPPPSMTSRTSSRTASRPAAVQRAAEEEDGHAHAGHHPGHGALALRAGRHRGHRHLDHRCAHVVGDDRRQHNAVRVAADAPSFPRQRFDQRLEPRLLRLLEHLAQQLERRRRDRIVHVDARHVLHAGPALGGRPRHAGHQAVVQLEDGAGQTGAVDGEVGAVQRGEVARRGQPGQRLGGGQDAVARGQRLGQGPEEGVPVLGGHHGTGAVVRRQNERGGGQRRGARHWAPASASTTLATAEKSSRP